MDSLTHLVAGALTPLVFRHTPRRAAVLWFGIAVGELPDIDVLFGTGPKALLTLHRGITHALIWQPVFVLIAVLPFFIWMHCRKPPLAALTGAGDFPAGRARLSTGALCLLVMYAMALVGVYTHIYLDSMTTFGTQIFLPFSDYRIALPAMFIVDPLLTVPALILMILAWREKADVVPYVVSPLDGLRPSLAPLGVPVASARARKLAVAGLTWILVYPLLALGINATIEAGINSDLPDGVRAHLLTEPFGPFVWKVVIDEGGSYDMYTLNLCSPGGKRIVERLPKPDAALYAGLERQLPLFGQFRAFCSYMVQGERKISPLAQREYSRPVRELFFVDMRYLMSPQGAARLIHRTDPNFVLEARMDDRGQLLAYRFLQRGKDQDKPWVEMR